MTPGIYVDDVNCFIDVKFLSAENPSLLHATQGKSVWLAKRFFSVSRISGKARLKTGKCNIFCSWGMDADLKSAKNKGSELQNTLRSSSG